jgi:urea transport system permease protein
MSTKENSLTLPAPAPLLSRTGWSAFIVALIVVCAVAPVLNMVVPQGSVFHMSDYAVALVGKIMCYAICALAMDLIWGYTGILSLGHGLFFALGGYVMGMYLMRQIGRDGNYKSDLPDFMVFLDWKTLPWHWTFSDSFIATLILIIAVPGLVAFVFGYFAFRSRIKGVYFSIITQAMTFAAMLLFFRNETGFGGNNGFTDFKRILGLPMATQSMRMTLFVLTGLTLLGCFLFARWLVRSKFGRVLQAIRDAETRVMFRLQPAALQADDLDHLRHHVRRGRRAVCAAGRHHQSRRDESGQLDRDRHLGGRGRTRHADRARSSALSSSTAPRAGSPWPRRSSGCTSSGPCSSLSRCSCPTGWSAW